MKPAQLTSSEEVIVPWQQVIHDFSQQGALPLLPLSPCKDGGRGMGKFLSVLEATLECQDMVH